MHPIGTAPSLFVRTPELSDEPAKTASAAAQSTTPSATPQQQAPIVPSRMVLGRSLVQVGSHKPLADQRDKALLPYLFKHEGEVNRELLPNGDAHCHYQVAHVPGDPDNPFEATLVFGPNSQLKELSAKSTSNPERTFPPTEFTPMAGSRPLGSSDLAKLPNEVLDRIAGHIASDDPNGVLALRQTNWHLNAIADSHITPAQRFWINHGQMCKDLDLDDNDKKAVFNMPQDQRNFIVSYGQALKDAGVKLLVVAKLPAAEREFIAVNAQTLKDAGLPSRRIIDIAKKPTSERDFIAAHAKTVKNLGGLASDILSLAREPEDVRDFVVNHGQTLIKDKLMGFHDVLSIAKEKSPEQRDFIAAKAQMLKDLGYGLYDCQVLGDQPAKVRNFVADHAETLFKAYDGNIYEAINFAKRDDRDTALQNLNSGQ